MIKISIIIPIFNVEEYLPKCLDSVLSQTLKDIEVICVNDGSTDGSLRVLQEYKSKDDRIIIIDKKNEGSGIARNMGLLSARGEYVYFADSDDWLEKETALETIYEAAEKDCLDILIFGGYSCYRKYDKIIKWKGRYRLDDLNKKYFQEVFSANDIKNDIFKFPSTAWTKLYRRDFLLENDIRFQPIKVGQDQLFFFHSMITAKRMKVLNKYFYCYRKERVGSVTAVRKKKNFSPIYVTRAIEELLKKLDKTEDYLAISIDRYFGKATSWLGRFDKDLKPEYYAQYIELLTHIQKSCNGWWKYFNPTMSDGYWRLKMKTFLAKQKFMLLK